MITMCSFLLKTEFYKNSTHNTNLHMENFWKVPFHKYAIIFINLLLNTFVSKKVRWTNKNLRDGYLVTWHPFIFIRTFCF